MKFQSIAAVILGLLGSGCSTLVSKVFPLDDLPVPSGPHAVGTQYFEWVDGAREEPFTEGADDKRRLAGQIWYPAEMSDDSLRQPYLDYPERRLDMISYQSGLPRFMVAHMQRVQTNSLLNAPLVPHSQKRPLVLFSHGLSGMKNQNTIQAELLASHGIIVVSVDHAYDAYLTIFADGTVADYRSSDTENRTGDAFWAFRLPQLKTRVADLAFVLDEVARRSGEAGSLWANIATDDVGVFGHSFGGATALMLAAQDDRVTKSMALDGWMVPVPPEVIAAGTAKPFYYLGQAAWDDPVNYKKLDKFLSASPQGKKQLEAGTKHFDYSDAPQFSNLAKRFGLSGEVSRPALRALINDAVMSFFINDVRRAQASEANLDQ